MKLYTHAIANKWIADEWIVTIKLIKSNDFKAVNVDPHKCASVVAAVAKAQFTDHNMRKAILTDVGVFCY